MTSYGGVSFEVVLSGPGWTAPDWEREASELAVSTIWDHAASRFDAVLATRPGVVERLRCRVELADGARETLADLADGAARDLTGYPKPGGDVTYTGCVLTSPGAAEWVRHSDGTLVEQVEVEFVRAAGA